MAHYKHQVMLTFLLLQQLKLCQLETNSTKIATTAYVDRETSALGTIATQDANDVNILGGVITGTTKTGQIQ